MIVSSKFICHIQKVKYVHEFDPSSTQEPVCTTSKSVLLVEGANCTSNPRSHVLDSEGNPHRHRENMRLYTEKGPQNLGIEPRTFLLCGDSANYSTTMPPCSKHNSYLMLVTLSQYEYAFNSIRSF